MKIRVSLSGLAREVAEKLNTSAARIRDAYDGTEVDAREYEAVASLCSGLRDHAVGVWDGVHSLADFADFYGLCQPAAGNAGAVSMGCPNYAAADLDTPPTTATLPTTPPPWSGTWTPTLLVTLAGGITRSTGLFTAETRLGKVRVVRETESCGGRAVYRVGGVPVAGGGGAGDDDPLEVTGGVSWLSGHQAVELLVMLGAVPVGADGVVMGGGGAGGEKGKAVVAS